MKVLITGGAGFVGSQLALHLKERGHTVVVFDNLVRRGSEINLPLFKRHGIEFIHGDVRNREDLHSVPARIDLICETSAQASAVTGYANPLFDLTNNTFGLVNVLEFARQHGAGVIFWSTNKVYSGDKVNAFPRKEEDTRWVYDREALANIDLPQGFAPDFGFSEDFSVDGGQHSIYGLSKVMGDLACQEYADAFGVRTVVNRFSCLAGKGQFGKSEQGWVTWWAVAFHFGLPLKYIGWGGKQVRDVLFIEDLCRLVELQMDNLERIAGQVYTVGGGISRTLSLVEATALVQESFAREVPIAVDDSPRKADHCIYYSDIRKAERDLGWSPQVKINDGFERIVEWVRANEELLRPLYM